MTLKFSQISSTRAFNSRVAEQKNRKKDIGYNLIQKKEERKKKERRKKEERKKKERRKKEERKKKEIRNKE